MRRFKLRCVLAPFKYVSGFRLEVFGYLGGVCIRGKRFILVLESWQPQLCSRSLASLMQETLQKDAQTAFRERQHHCEPHFFTISCARILVSIAILEQPSFADADSSSFAEDAQTVCHSVGLAHRIALYSGAWPPSFPNSMSREPSIICELHNLHQRLFRLHRSLTTQNSRT